MEPGSRSVVTTPRKIIRWPAGTIKLPFKKLNSNLSEQIEQPMLTRQHTVLSLRAELEQLKGSLLSAPARKPQWNCRFSGKML
jgi:hypothetical protein